MSRNRLNVFGQNGALPGALTSPSSINGGASGKTPLIIIQASNSVTAPYVSVYHSDGTPVWEVVASGNQQVYGITIGAAADGAPVLDGTQNPPALQMNDGSSSGMRVWAGTGAPGANTVGTPTNGDEYHRIDTPSTSNQRVYKYVNGSWTGIL